MSSLQAFPRADGSVGIRNIVLVVSTVTCANTVVNHIAWKTGAVPLTHERGCVEGEQSFRRTMLALTTFAKHPNVSGVLIVGLGCEQIRTLDLQIAIGGGKQVQTATNEQTQALITAPVDGCYMTGVGDLTGNTAKIDYAAIVTPLSNTMKNATVANVVFVIEWDTVA